MAKGKLVVFTNPISAAREVEFNRWYDDIHVPDVVGLPGFRRVTRFRAKAQLLPPADKPSYGYMAIYDLDDVDLAMSNLAAEGPKMTLTEAIDASDVLEVVYEPFFNYEK